MRSQRTAPTAVDLLVQHGTVVTMDPAKTILYDGAVAIDSGRIVAIGPEDEILGRYVGLKTINAGEKAVLPGLIDTHHHFLQNFLKGARDDLPFVEWIAQISSPLISLAIQDYLDGSYELQRQATRLGCTEALLSGITTILNMEWATAPQIVDVYEQAGLRVVHTLYLTDVDQWGSPGMLLPIDATMDLADRLIRRCSESDGGRVTFRYGPACENSASTGLLGEIRSLADENHVGIHIHVAESQFGWDNIHQLHNKTPVEYLRDIGFLGPDVLGAHCIWLSDNDIQILKDSGASVSYSPECHMKLALGVAPIVKMLEAGVPVSLATDTCAVNDNMDIFEAMRAGAFLQKISTMDPSVLPAYQALEMATMGGAVSLGMAGDIGSLEVGKKADLILVDLSGTHMQPINNLINNLVYCASAASDVKTVIVDGRIIVEEGTLLSWGEGQVVAEALEYANSRFREARLPVSAYYQ